MFKQSLFFLMIIGVSVCTNIFAMERKDVATVDEKAAKTFVSREESTRAALFCDAVCRIVAVRLQAAREALRVAEHASREDFNKQHFLEYAKTKKDTIKQERDRYFAGISDTTLFKKKVAALEATFHRDIALQMAKPISNKAFVDFYATRSYQLKGELTLLHLEFELPKIGWRIQRPNGTWMYTSDPEVKKRVELQVVRAKEEKQKEEAQIRQEAEARAKAQQDEEARRVREEQIESEVDAPPFSLPAAAIVAYASNPGGHDEEDYEGDEEYDTYDE